MEVSIIVVNYNSRVYLESCLASLQTNTKLPYEVIVVDNHSADDSLTFLSRLRYPNLRVIANETNSGYATACNQGIHAAKGDILVTMNPDVLVPPDGLARMIWHLDRNPNALAIGPKGIGISGRQAPLPLSFSSRFEAAARKFAAVYAHQSEPAKYLIGCLFLFSRRLIKEIGCFDEGLPLGADDFDLALRIRKAGFEMRIARDVLIKHFVHVSFNNSNPAACKKLEDASYRHFYAKWSQELGTFGWKRLFEDETPVFPGETTFPTPYETALKSNL